MRIVFIGCVKFSYAILLHLLDSVTTSISLSGIVTRRQSAFNADFYSLEDLAKARNINCFIAEGNDQKAIADWMRSIRPDVVYCFGWSYLLSQEILSIPPLGVIGYHPAALPRNRGRHPIVWALVLGLLETASTFFFMDECADSGDILSQQSVSISNHDDAEMLYGKLTDTALRQISEFTAQLASNSYPRVPQDHSKANYWRKRSKLDGQIDWRMSAISIHNLVRALARPYPGAHCVHNEEEVKIWKSELVEESALNSEPGKILRISGRTIWIKCGEGVLLLLSHEFAEIPEKGSYL